MQPASFLQVLPPMGQLLDDNENRPTFKIKKFRRVWQPTLTFFITFSKQILIIYSLHCSFLPPALLVLTLEHFTFDTKSISCIVSQHQSKDKTSKYLFLKFIQNIKVVFFKFSLNVFKSWKIW